MTDLSVSPINPRVTSWPYCLSRFCWVLAIGLSLPLAAADEPTDATTQTPAAFDQDFLPRTMRVDYFHSGTAAEEHVALERIVSDGLWSGTRHQLVDPIDAGLYRFEVRDAASDRLLYAHGFCSVFGEWQTTAPAKAGWGTFHESLRFPWPLKPVKVLLQRRDAGAWRDIWSHQVEPDSRFITNAESPRRDEVWTVFEHGDPSEKVDIVFLGDGYTKDELPKFHQSVKNLTERLFSVEPFRQRRTDFNVRAIDVVAAESGISKPRANIFRRSPLGCAYNAFDLPRYVLTFENREVRDIAAQAPYDYLVILLNEQTYGGGGIYNDQTTVVADNLFSGYILVHEFGHHMGGLGDEYYTSDVAYQTGQPITIEPWEPNVTALLDPIELKWKDLVEPDTPLPTPWNKDAYEAQRKAPAPSLAGPLPAAGAPAAVTTALDRERDRLTNLLKDNPYYGKVGAFEGAAYEPKGLYRPAIDCVMFSRNLVEFCPVCQRAIEQVIDSHVK